MIDANKPYRAKNMIQGMNIVNNQNNISGNGFLDVTVLHYKTNEPIKGALVRISTLTISGIYNEKGTGNLIDQYTTDENGKIPIVSLPPINRLEISNEQYNKVYVMSVHAEGYNSAYVFDIQIYSGITTTYTIYLRHTSTKEETEFEFILNPQIPGL